MWWDFVIANPPTPQSVAVYNSWVDVRDLAVAHVLALQRPGAGGERLIISAGELAHSYLFSIARAQRR
jgi:nucleoside-diphosphate-sugar epimerase